MSILGLDIGDRRIGIALAEDSKAHAHALLTLGNNRAFLNELTKLRFKYGFDRIVVGIPYNLSGGDGEQAAKVRKLAAKIQTKLGVEVSFEDERMTTKAAASLLRARGVGDIDSVSAEVILGSWLSHQSGV